jgi:hypothetical protein
MGNDDLDLLHVGDRRGDDHRRRRVIACDGRQGLPSDLVHVGSRQVQNPSAVLARESFLQSSDT